MKRTVELVHGAFEKALSVSRGSRTLNILLTGDRIHPVTRRNGELYAAAFGRDVPTTSPLNLSAKRSPSSTKSVLTARRVHVLNDSLFEILTCS